MRDIVESSLKGIERKEKRRKENEKRYRSGSDTSVEREKKNSWNPRIGIGEIY